MNAKKVYIIAIFLILAAAFFLFSTSKLTEPTRTASIKPVFILNDGNPIQMGAKFSLLIRKLLQGPKYETTTDRLQSSGDMIVVDGKEFLWDCNSISPYRGNRFRFTDGSCELGLYYAAYYYIINNSKKDDGALALKMEIYSDAVININENYNKNK